MRPARVILRALSRCEVVLMGLGSSCSMGGILSSGSGDREGNEVSEASSVDSGLLSTLEPRFLVARSVLVRLLSLDVLDACEDERRDVLLAESEWTDESLAGLAAVPASILSVMFVPFLCRHLVAPVVRMSIARLSARCYIHNRYVVL